MSRLGRCALLLTAAKVGAIRTVSTAAMTSAPAMHAETILATVALVVTVLVLAGILLRLAPPPVMNAGKPPTSCPPSWPP